MTTVVEPVKTSGVDWKSVIAGAIAASAIFGLLTAFGTALGLSMTSAHRGSGVSGTTLAIAAAIWIVMVHVWSFVAGGYLAGRLSDVPDLQPEEAEFRAGANGFMVWALGTVISLVFLAFVERNHRSIYLRSRRTIGVWCRSSCIEPSGVKASRMCPMHFSGLRRRHQAAHSPPPVHKVGLTLPWSPRLAASLLSVWLMDRSMRPIGVTLPNWSPVKPDCPRRKRSGV